MQRKIGAWKDFNLFFFICIEPLLGLRASPINFELFLYEEPLLESRKIPSAILMWLEKILSFSVGYNQLFFFLVSWLYFQYSFLLFWYVWPTFWNIQCNDWECVSKKHRISKKGKVFITRSFSVYLLVCWRLDLVILSPFTYTLQQKLNETTQRLLARRGAV